MRPTGDGVRVAVHLTPRARADRIDGIRKGVDGRAMLCVAVTAPPADNRANDALLRLLAHDWRIPRRDLAIIGGHKSRDKLVTVAGDPAVMVAHLTAALTIAGILE